MASKRLPCRLKALPMQCLAVLLVDMLLVAAVRDDIMLDRFATSSESTLPDPDGTLPNQDAFVTTRNFRCKANNDGTPACTKYHKSLSDDYFWCYTDTPPEIRKWDYCTPSPLKTAHGKTCKDIQDVHFSPSSGIRRRYAWCKTIEGGWDYCRYPATNFVPDKDYNEIKGLLAASEKTRKGPPPATLCLEGAQDGGGVDYEAEMNCMVEEKIELQHPSIADLRMQTGQRGWCGWETAGWNKDDRKFASKQTADEWQNTSFQMRLLEHTVKSGTQCCTSYNNQLHVFQKPDNAMAYLNWHKAQVPDKERIAIFVLGPSAAGKTSIVASLGKLREKMAYKFPAVTFDGGDVREVSEVWKRYAQEGGKWKISKGCKWPGSHKDGTRYWVSARGRGCLLSKYFKDVTKPYLKPNLKKLMFQWIEEYKPKTVLIPETAVPCVTTIFTKFCKILKTIKKFKDLGYTIKFVVVYAPLEQVRQAGMRRALTEGKQFSSSSYALALYGAKKLYKKFRGNSEFIFVNNTWTNNKLPEEISWTIYRRVVSKAIRRQIAELIR